MKTQITLPRRDNTWLIIFLILGMLGKITMGCAQGLASNQKTSDSAVYYLKHKQTIYYGVQLAMSTPQFIITSNIPQINNMSASFFGGNAGAVVANERGKLKASIGSFSTDASVPHAMELLQGSVSGSFYFLRTKAIEAHTFEPYFSVGLSRIQAKFFGNYINDNNATKNYSKTEMPSLGEISWTRANVAVGVEYQLESEDKKFIHLFAEMGYGIPFQTSSSNSAFNSTKASGNSWISVGINLGITK